MNSVVGRVQGQQQVSHGWLLWAEATGASRSSNTTDDGHGTEHIDDHPTAVHEEEEHFEVGGRSQTSMDWPL